MSENDEIREDNLHLEEVLARFERESQSGAYSYYDSEDIEDMCNHYGSQGKFEKVDSLIKLGRQQHPDDETIFQLEIRMLIEHRQYEQALQLSSTSSFANDSYIYYLRTMALLNLERFEDAEKEAVLAMDCEADNQFVCQDVAQLLFNHGRFNAALACLKRAEKIDPEDEETLLNISSCYNFLSQNEKALQYIDKLLDKDPYFIQAWQNKTSIHLDMDNGEAALEDLEYALAIAPDDEGLNLAKVRTLVLLKRDQEAMEWLDEIEKTQPQLQGIVEMNRGDIMFYQKDFKKAHQFYKRGYDPEYFAVDSTIRYLDCKLILHKWREAVQIGKHLMMIMPYNTEVIERLSDAYYELKEVNKSLRLIRKCVKLSPDDIHFQLRYGSLLLDTDDYSKAFTVFRKARQKDTKNVLANTMLAVVCFLKRDIRKMYRYLQEAENEEPQIRDGFYKLCPEAKNIVEKIDAILKEGHDMGIKNPEQIVLGRSKL